MIGATSMAAGITDTVTPVYVRDASNATFTVLSASTTKVPGLHGIILSANTAGFYTIKIGGTIVLRVNLADVGGLATVISPIKLCKGVVNEAITIDKPSAGADVSVTAYISEV